MEVLCVAVQIGIGSTSTFACPPFGGLKVTRGVIGFSDARVLEADLGTHPRSQDAPVLEVRQAVQERVVR